MADRENVRCHFFNLHVDVSLPLDRPSLGCFTTNIITIPPSTVWADSEYAVDRTGRLGLCHHYGTYVPRLMSWTHNVLKSLKYYLASASRDIRVNWSNVGGCREKEPVRKPRGQGRRVLTCLSSRPGTPAHVPTPYGSRDGIGSGRADCGSALQQLS
jgi:hypothetical protein